MLNETCIEFTFFFFFAFLTFALLLRIERSVRPTGALSGCPCGHPNCLKQTTQRVLLDRMVGDALTPYLSRGTFIQPRRSTDPDGAAKRLDLHLVLILAFLCAAGLAVASIFQQMSK
jgi:hypothetical protein